MENSGTLRPLLFIGCGGSGGKTLRFAHDAIMRRLRRVKWEGEMPEAWQFLWIDVPKEQEGGDEFGSRLPGENYTGLVSPGTNYWSGVDKAVMGMRNCDPMELVGWRPDPPQVKILIEDGAGQFRAIGRMISVRQGASIKSAIERALLATTSASARVEFEDVVGRLGCTPDNATRAFLVSSLAGGTGAGIFLDVADILAINLKGDTDSTSAILYTADVFTGDKNISGVQGVEGNSLASLAELLAGSWQDEERSLSLFRSQGMSSSTIRRGGIAHSFLVGGTNSSGVTLGSASEVYRSMGESLALIAMSSDVQMTFTRFVTTQWAESGGTNSDLMGLQDPYAVAPTSSLGYSRLGLGRDKFQEYAIDRLARSAIEFLRVGYLRTGQSGVDAMTPAEALAAIVQENKLTFLTACGLNEREDSNQIIDALRPPSLDELWNQINVAVSQKQSGAKDSDLPTWLDRIGKTAELLYREFDDGFHNALNSSTRTWAEGATDRLLDAVGDHCARFGLRVTQELLAEMKLEFDVVGNKLEAESNDFKADAQNWRGRIKQLGLPESDRFGAGHPKMAKLIQNVTSPKYFTAKSEIQKRAIKMMSEFANSVIDPLETALKAAQASFDSGMVGRNGQPPDFMNWPGDVGVPNSILPSKVEFLLDDVTKYPDMFVNLVAASTTAEEAAGNSSPISVAMQHVIRGGFQARSTKPIDFSVRRDGHGLPLDKLGPWRPTDAGGAGERLAFIAEFSVDDLRYRAEQWTLRPGAFRNHLEESLSAYLSPRDANKELVADHEERLSTFGAKLAATLAASSPLIDVDTNIYGVTHPMPLQISRVIEPFPFDEGHPARQIVKDALIKHSQSEGSGSEPDASAFTSANAGIGSVGVISYFPNPMHPVVFRSVTKPIDAKLQEGLSKFWQWRRTRRLAEFIPVGSSARRAMTRGWFTARLLGLLDSADLKAPITILSEDGKPLAFPHVPLGGFIDNDDLPLAAVLESMPLAWIGWSAGRSEAVEPYRRLLHLGLSDPLLLTQSTGDGTSDQRSLYEYARANVELAKWVQTGEAALNASPIVSGTDPESRLASVMAVLDTMRQTLGESFTMTSFDSTALLRAPRGVDLIKEVLEEVHAISNAKYELAPPPPVY